MHCTNDETTQGTDPTTPSPPSGDDDDGCYCGGYGSGSGGLYQIINVNSNEYGSSKSAKKRGEEDGRRRLLDEDDDENTGHGDGRGAASKGGSDTKGNGNFVVMGDHNIINYNTGDVGGSAGLSPCICGDDSYGSGTVVGSDGRPGSPGVAPKGKKNKNNSTKTTNTTKTCRCACTCPDGRSGYRPGATDGRPGAPDGRPGAPSGKKHVERPGAPSARYHDSNATFYSEQWQDEYSGAWFPHHSSPNCTNFGGAYCPGGPPEPIPIPGEAGITAGVASGKIPSQLVEA